MGVFRAVTIYLGWVGVVCFIMRGYELRSGEVVGVYIVGVGEVR